MFSEKRACGFRANITQSGDRRYLKAVYSAEVIDCYCSTFAVAGSARKAATWAGSKWAMRSGVSWSSSGVGSPATWLATKLPMAGARAKPCQEARASVSPSSPETLPMKGRSSRLWDILAVSTFMTHTVCERSSRQRATEGLSPRVDLQEAHAPHVQPIASPGLRDADERGIAGGTAYDRPHAMYVGCQRTNDIRGTAACTGGLNKCHIKGKDLLQDARGRIAIKLVLHHVSPVGPNRSVLMRTGSYPRVTRLAAAVSTNGVGPQINARGR